MAQAGPTIVSVATPALIDSFDASVNEVLRVTSGHLLGYAVPLRSRGPGWPAQEPM